MVVPTVLSLMIDGKSAFGPRKPLLVTEVQKSDLCLKIHTFARKRDTLSIRKIADGFSLVWLMTPMAH